MENVEKGLDNKIIKGLQSLRFIAVLFVFYTHITSDHIIYATCGVSFFVILSGFLYGYKTVENKKTLKETISLVKSRILKFYPLYLITLILCIPLETRIPSVRTVIQNLLLLQCYSTTHYFIFNGVSWFLSMMMTLSILTYPLKRVITKIRKSSILIGIFFILVIANFIYCYCLNKMQVNLQYWLYVCQIVRILEYTCGMIIGYLIKKKSYNISKMTATILEIFSIGIIIVILMIPNIPQYIHRNFIWIIPMCLLISVVSIERGVLSKILQFKWLVYLGNISFEFFMTHQIILRYVEKYQILAGMNFVLKFVVELIACILLAQIVSYYLKSVKIDIELKDKATVVRG